MSDKRSPEDRVEKRRISVENDTIKLNILKTIKKLGLTNGGMEVHMSMLEVIIAVDLSGEEWDDDYNPKDGGNSR